MAVDLSEIERAFKIALKKLKSENQRAFVREYPIDLNATQAAIRAGYSKNGAGVEACRLLMKPNVQVAIQLAMELRSERTQITADNVLVELRKLVFSDLRKMFNESGGLLHPKDWPDDIAGAISSVEVEELFEGVGRERQQVGYTKKIRLWDKNAALEKIGRHLKMWDANQVSINILQSKSDADLDAAIQKFIAKADDGSQPPKPKAKG